MLMFLLLNLCVKIVRQKITQPYVVRNMYERHGPNFHDNLLLWFSLVPLFCSRPMCHTGEE